MWMMLIMDLSTVLSKHLSKGFCMLPLPFPCVGVKANRESALTSIVHINNGRTYSQLWQWRWIDGGTCWVFLPASLNYLLPQSPSNWSRHIFKTKHLLSTLRTPSIWQVQIACVLQQSAVIRNSLLVNYGMFRDRSTWRAYGIMLRKEKVLFARISETSV